MGSMPEEVGALANALGGTVGLEVAGALQAAVDRMDALPATYAPIGAFPGLELALDAAARSVAVQVLGDSTGNANDEWVYLLAQAAAARYPAWTVQQRLWDDVNEQYGAPTTIQTGTDGVRYATFPVKSLRLAPTAITAITGDIDVRAEVLMDDWTPAANQTIVARFGAGGSRAFRLYMNTAGRLNFEWSTDGTTLVAVASTNPLSGVVDGVTKLFLRGTLDVDNGSNGYTATVQSSTDGLTWTTLGTSTTTSGGPTTIFNPTSQEWEIGARGHNGEKLAGRIYSVDIRSGIDGTPVAPRLPDGWQRRADADVTFVGGPILTFVNGSRSGAGLSYLTDATRLPKMTPDFGQVAALLSCSHNDGWDHGNAYLALWDSWLSSLKSRMPAATFGVIAQNPRKAPASAVAEHAQRAQQLLAWGKRNGLVPIDIYSAFLAGDLAALVDVDGIHPTAAGSAVWANAVKPAVLGAA